MNQKDEFELAFTEETSGEIPSEAYADELPEQAEELVAKTEVIILTNNYRIRGKIALVPGARLTDYIVSASTFIAVTDVEVKDNAGKLVLTTPFLNVGRDHIEIILPAEFAML